MAEKHCKFSVLTHRKVTIINKIIMFTLCMFLPTSVAFYIVNFVRFGDG